ncbi:hypothetical protein JCM11672_26880 [Alkaliphilus crotonatoxidans]
MNINKHLKWMIPICGTLLGSAIAVYGMHHQFLEKPMAASYLLEMDEVGYIEQNQFQNGKFETAEENPEQEEEEASDLGEEEEDLEENKEEEEKKDSEKDLQGKEDIQVPPSTDSGNKAPEKEIPPKAVEPVNRGEVERDKLLKQDLNSYILDVIKTYSSGNYPYLLNNDYANYNGVTTNLYYQDQLLLKAHPNGSKASHCVGITFEVFFKAMMNRNEKLGLPKDDFNGMTWNELYDFALGWFVANGNKAQNNAARVIEKYGLGKVVTNLEEVKAGDIIDFSRENHTGHTVIFINWIRDNGKIVGLKYWSSQGSTNGISYNEEYFNIPKGDGSKYGNVIIDQLYIGRVLSVNEYQ